MFQVSKNLTKNIIQKPIFGFSGGLFNKRKATPKDLEHYDVIWIGCNLGGICSSHFDHAVHGKYKMMAFFDNPINQVQPFRIAYEMQLLKKSDYLLNTSLAVNMYTAKSDGIGIKSIIPEENKIIMRNGREVKYNHAVIATGMQQNVDAISGFEDAWVHEEHPVYASKDHQSWKGYLHKYPKFHYNFTYGEAFIAIPPYPFSGEVENYNWFLADEVWKQFKSTGKQHPFSKLTILNANDKFVQYNDAADLFIKEQIQKRGIKVEYGKNLVGVDKDNWRIKVADVKTGETEEREYHNLYSLLPCKPQQYLQDAGLLSGNGLLDVNQQTLQHNKYKNIFGLGDACDLPTTKSFFGGWQQIHVVRNNLERSLNNQTLNAHYNGYTLTPLYMGQGALTYVEHTYNNEATWKNVNDNSLAQKWFFKEWNKKKNKFIDYYLFKTWGPPYHKIMKKFNELPGSPEELTASQQGFAEKYFAKKAH